MGAGGMVWVLVVDRGWEGGLEEADMSEAVVAKGLGSIGWRGNSQHCFILSIAASFAASCNL